MTPLHDLSQSVRLAWRDFRHEWRMSACLVLGLTAVLLPLLVLFGLKFGIMESLGERLRADPRNLELVPVGAGRYDREWFAALAARPGVGFLIPRTRAIAATADLANPAGGMASVELIPTAAGDPVPLPGPVPGTGEGLLSAAAARRLGVETGAEVILWVTRGRGGEWERASTRVRVVGVIPESRFGREALFTPLELLAAVEDYRDGRGVPALGWGGEEGPPRTLYAGFRLYARDLTGVLPLREHLRALGVEPATRAAEIETVQALDRNLTLVFRLVAALGVGGFFLSLGASLWSNVERKRRELSVLRLVGFRTRAIVAFPLVQAALTGGLGWAVAVAGFGGAARLINLGFAHSLRPGELACRLEPLHLLTAGGVTLGVALAASSLAGVRAARLDPAEGLRDV